MIGKQFNRLTVISQVDKDKYLCKCDCGKTRIVEKRRLVENSVKCCKACVSDKARRLLRENRQRAILDKYQKLIGTKIARLTIVEFFDSPKKGQAYLLKCQCECGNTRITTYGELNGGKVSECRDCAAETRRRAGIAMQGNLDPMLFEGTAITSIRSTTINKNNTSGVRGVSFNKAKKKWIAQITFQRKNYNLGGYDTFEEAVTARQKGEEEYFQKTIRKYQALKDKS